jgi:CheY-like chemotaxis protein
MQTGPIVIVEDDEDDKEIIEEVLKELKIPNKTIYFTRCPEAFDYLKTHNNQPFIIFCDINLPEQSGIEFKRKIDTDPQLRQKSIPFVFLSTSAEKEYVNEAYGELTVQGYFQKANSYTDCKNMIRLILEYWKICKHPNN